MYLFIVCYLLLLFVFIYCVWLQVVARGACEHSMSGAIRCSLGIRALRSCSMRSSSVSEKEKATTIVL